LTNNQRIAYQAIYNLGHALGMGEEHQRPDRDEYLTIDMNNIAEKYRDQYKKNKYGFI
jgi:hypothetical protein